MSTQSPEAGYLYAVSGGEQYFKEAIRSVRSLREVDTNAHASIAVPAHARTEIQLERHFDRVLELEYPAEGGPKKFTVEAMRRASPYEKTFFLDTDTYFIDNCRSLFGILDNHQICLRHAPCDMHEIPGEPDAYTPYNTGVILYRKDESVLSLFSDWKKSIEKRDYIRDQPSFMEALSDKGINLYVMRNNWNARFPYFEAYSGRVHLLHGRWDNVEYVAERINASTNNRAWLPILESCIHRHMTLSEVLELIPRFFDGLRRRFLNTER
ncbi:glycosyltransferase family 77 protein [Salinibacter ruber]|uniref:Nucleotide-diphospho-sugar transferase domain-containing protein n=1 Tax=Salinibacter ruber TaxID=146919 RepID=A0A9X2V7K8_9BACT|nr:glycosyltransferase family 77 protein [Salinibacter ruber]MCS4122729.1 hypothetical protein [Salinibacter ruber]